MVTKYCRVAKIVGTWERCSEEVETERGNGGKFSPTRAKNGVFALSKVKKGPNRASCAALIKLWFTAFIAIIEKVKHTFPEKQLFVS